MSVSDERTSIVWARPNIWKLVMFRTFRSIAFVIVLALSTGHVSAQDAVPIKTVMVADGIHMLMGRGGNVAVSTGADGTYVIEDQYASQYEVMKQAIATLSTDPFKFLVNTHWHSDHTGGNEQMGSNGAIIVAHENVRQRVSTDQVGEFFNAERPASPSVALPIVTFYRDITFHLNENDVHVFHVRNVHTDGDAVVHFKQANVVHTGDVFFHGRYPFIDTGSGGSIQGTIGAVDCILAIADAETRVIPGHGELAYRKGLEEYLVMLKGAQKAMAQLIVAGNSVEQAVLAKPTAAFDAIWGNGFLKPDVFVKTVYDSIKRSTLR